MKKALTVFLVLIISVSTLFAAPRQPKAYKVDGKSNVKVICGGDEYSAYTGSMNGSSKAYFNLKSEYSELSFIYGIKDDSRHYEGVIQVLGDGEVLAEYEYEGGMLPEKATVNVEYVNQLIIDWDTYAFVADLEFV